MALSLQELRGGSPTKASERSSDWPDWSHQTAVVVACGPSLSERDLALLHDQHRYGSYTLRVVAINEAGLRRFLPKAAPWADALYAADRVWWQHYRPAFAGLRVSGEPVPPAKDPATGELIEVPTRPLKMVSQTRGDQFPRMPREPGSVVTAGHSGFQALGLALSLGATRVILLGYDCGAGAGSGMAARNAHPDRAPQFGRTDPPYHQWAAAYEHVPGQWPEVEFVNCCPTSRIAAFRKAPLREVL